MQKVNRKYNDSGNYVLGGNMEQFAIELKDGTTSIIDMSIFEIDEEKNLVNLTKMGNPFDIRIDNFKRKYLPSIEAIAKREGIILVDNWKAIPQIWESVKGGDSSKVTQGTWAHRKVAIMFAQYISPDFHAWTMDVLDELFQKGTVSLNTDSRKLPTNFRESLQLLLEQEDRLLAQEEQIRQDKKMMVKQQIEIDHKEEVISGFVDDLTIHKKRDLILKVITTTQNQFEIPQRWNILYNEYKNVHHVDLKRLKENFNKKQTATKDKMPSILKYAEIIGGDECINRLFELSAKLFDTDQLDVLKGLYRATKRETQKKVEYAENKSQQQYS